MSELKTIEEVERDLAEYGCHDDDVLYWARKAIKFEADVAALKRETEWLRLGWTTGLVSVGIERERAEAFIDDWMKDALLEAIHE